MISLDKMPFLPRRIAWRLALGFGLMVALMAVLMAVTRHHMTGMTSMTQQVANHDLPKLLRIQLLTLHSESTGTGLLQLMNLPRERRVPVYTVIDERNRQMQGVIDSLSQAGELGETGQTALAELRTARDAYQQAYLEMVDHIEADDPKQAQQVLVSQVQPALERMQALSAQLQSRERDAILSSLAQTWQGFERNAVVSVVLFVVALVVAVVLAWVTARSVVNPLTTVTAGARRIASGDYTHPVALTQTEEVDDLVNAMNQMAQAVEQREQDVRRMAFTDALTDLPNRQALLAWSAAANGVLPGGVLWVMDIARLRAINETLGFAAGDTVIVQTAQRLQALVPPHGLLAYVSGGRFALWLPGARPDGQEALQQQVAELSAHAMACGEQRLDVQLVTGMAHCDGCADAALPLPQLLRNAEVAQLTAKRKTLPWAWYEPEHEAARLEQLGLLSDLREAALHDQLQMWLQPKVSVPGAQLIGSEALVRWVHPTRGFVSPADFVPFAERTGAVTVLTQWMLKRAIACLARWQATGEHLTGIAVNLSTRDLLDPGLPAQLGDLLARHNLNPGLLTLEVTESGLMDDPDHAMQTLDALRTVGVKLSIDDFGTGYSSLAYLQRLPVHELKIDRSFVQALDQRPANGLLVGAMVTMAHGLQLSVTAEGVETAAEADSLRHLGVDVIQGYLFGKPMPEVAFETWRTAHMAQAWPTFFQAGV